MEGGDEDTLMLVVIDGHGAVSDTANNANQVGDKTILCPQTSPCQSGDEKQLAYPSNSALTDASSDLPGRWVECGILKLDERPDCGDFQRRRCGCKILSNLLTTLT